MNKENLTGNVFSGYLLKKKLGHGAFGQIYLGA